MPDILYAGAHVTTLAAEWPEVDALLVRGQRIAAVGSVAECRDAARVGYAEVDLGGGWVVPGFVDSHVHLGWYAWSKHRLDLTGVTDVAEVQRRLAAYARELPAGAWVLGGGYDPAAFGRDVHRRDLDEHSGGRPVALESNDCHCAWVNTLGLRRLGIDDGPPPAGGRVDRDAAGPTGVLRENATAGVRALVAERVGADGETLFPAAFADLLAHGVTSVHDIDGYDAAPAYAAIRGRGELPVRVHQLISRDRLDEAVDAGVATGDGDSWLNVGPVKLFTDGALGSHTAALSSPYEDAPGDTGLALMTLAELTERIGYAARGGIASAVHAIGDAANRTVLDAVAEVRRQRVGVRLRHRVEHAQHVARRDVARFAELGVVASMQPVHCTDDLGLVASLLGDRPLASYAWADLAAAGAHVAFGSDIPVVTVDPVAGIRAATTRTDPATGRRDRDPTNTVTPLQALRAYTVEGAYASAEEHVKGRLAPGYLADFVTLDADLTCPDVATSGQARSRVTVVGGDVRWQAS